MPPAGVTEKPSAARQKVVVALLFATLASAWTLPEMWDGIGRSTQSKRLGVEAYRDIHVIVARQKEQGIAFGAELISSLRGVDPVDLLLD